MGLHGIVMESMKMTHVYATKIHDIFWDRMRLTAYIYGCISIVEHNQNHEQHQWTLQWPYHQNKISCFSLGQYHWKYIYIYVIYSKSHDLNCGDHLFYPPFPHAFPTGSIAGGAQRPLHGWLHHHGGGLRSGPTGGEGWIFPWVFVCLPGIPSGKLT